MLRTGSKYWIIHFGVWKYQSLISVVNLFTFYLLQGLAAADPMPSSNLSATKCSSSKVSNSESECLTITLGFSFHLFICIAVTEKFWDFSQTHPSKVICIHPWAWYFNPLSLSYSHFRLLLLQALSNQLTSLLRKAAEQRWAEQILKCFISV